jgi:hypothetical protein
VETNRPGDWIQTYLGGKFYTLDPRPEEVELEDIAHALSMTCRYNGHCERFYSVAEHSVLVARHLPLRFKLWGLLHDASEAYVNDINRPTKKYMPEYKTIEANIMIAICQRFDLDLREPPEVKAVDNGILQDECEQNMKKPPAEWHITDPKLGIKLKFWTPPEAKYWFLETFWEIQREMNSLDCGATA